MIKLVARLTTELTAELVRESTANSVCTAIVKVNAVSLKYCSEYLHNNLI
jgi:hypothetical protein